MRPIDKLQEVNSRAVPNSFNLAPYIIEVSHKAVNHAVPCGRSYIVHA